MRITITHNKTQQEAIRNIDQAVDDLFTQVPIAGLQILDKQKQWDGNVMHFSVKGKMGFFTAPIRGTVVVTDHDVTLDIELPGILGKFIPEEKIRAQVEGRVKGLLA
jgi:hypothetical protein